MTQTISNIIKETIKQYRELKLDGKTVVTPYFINDKRRKDLRAMVGKGTPEEIIMESKIWEKLKGTDFDTMNEDSIKQFLIDRGIGIDCSGFITHILDSQSQQKTGKHVWNFLRIPQNGIIWKLRYWLRPVEQLGAEVLTDKDNTIPISIDEVMPGDLIRSKAKKNNGHHIMIITEVDRNENNSVKSITYTHSSAYYGTNNGIKEGKIEIVNPNAPLKDQNWLEVDETGENNTLDGFLINNEDNGLRRLKCFNEIF